MCNKCNYVALHNHSHYSALDGYATIEEYIKVAKDNGMEGIGLADHGTASGLYSFIMQAQKAGLTPVPGIEFYVAPENPLGAKCKEPVYYGTGGIRNEEYDVSFGAYTHLTVFAYNNQGLFNLFKLTSLSWETENFYFKPRIDTNMLAQYSEGLIVTTGCPSSEVNKRFLLGQDEKAYAYATRLKEIFGENLYVELMDHKMEKEELERILMPKLMKLAKDLDLKVIATNDSHYAFKTDAEAHERVLAVSTRSSMDELPYFEGGKRFAFSTPDYYIKNYEEMKALYPEEVAEEALANTIELMNKCKGIKLEYDAHLRPEIEIPEGHTAVSYFQELVYEGFKKKRGHEPREVQEESIKRIKEEFTVIHSNDFISYFLVVHDYIKFAHDNGIGVGAGRGSIGGSEIAYVLDISNTDPIRFDLLFERFLSPGRGSIYQIDYMTGESEEVAVSDKKRVYSSDRTSKIVYIHELNPGDTVNFNQKKQVIKNVFVKVPGSAPDVDTDFHTEGREKVVEYCIEKYGKENVANIITFGTFKAKRAFKAMCTIYKVPFAQANAISNFIPGMQGAEYSLKEIMDPSSPKYNEGVDFRNAIEDNPAMEEIVSIASELDGRISETGVHACGVIISSKPLAGVIPTQVRQDDGKLITQWEYPELEALGLIKMDFLGLELINTVQQTLENIELSNKATNDPRYIREVPNMRELILGPMDDKESYKTMQDGNTVGIFQLGSPGVRELLKMSKPEFFMEIANITALYRPGPMKSGAHIQYANRKAGKEEVVYIHEEFRGTAVEDILKETYGLLIFQEQIMLIAGRYAGMTPYETDKLRKAIGKKKMDVMMAMKPKFIKGCMAQGASKEASDILWDTIEVFGQYGFNKCAWSETLISTVKHGKLRLKDLYKMQEENPDEDIEIYSMYEDGQIKPHTIKKIVYTGRKPLYTIITESGKKIRVTKEHRMLTTSGYKTIEDGGIAVGKELIVDAEWTKRLHPETIQKRKEVMSLLNKTEDMREKAKERMIKYQSTLTFEDRSAHQSKISQTSNRHEICLPKGREKLKELRKSKNWTAKFAKSCEEARHRMYESGEYTGFGKPTQLSNGLWADSMLEALAGEYLLSRGVDFELHKTLVSETTGTTKICDFYVNGLYFEMDGLGRGKQYFKEHKYGDLPFVYMTPFDYKDVIDEAIMTHHIENGEKIVEIIPPKTTPNGKPIGAESYDIEMEENGPSNFIAEGMVSHNSHSVSYAINIYETVFLKTHYPSEFMAALIQQGFGTPEKVKMYIQEAMRMKLKLGAVDINSSEVKMASTGILPNREYDIVFGFSGVKQLNNTLAQEIVDERNENGKYKSVADFVKRLTKRAGLTGAPLESLALAGAFDCFGVSRKMVAEKAKMLIDSANKKEAKGLSLFDMMAGPSQDVAEGIELVGEEYTYSELIKKEAETIGMFISGHPTAKLGHIATRFSPTSLSKLLNSTSGSKETFTVLATITQMKAKTNKAGNKSIAVLIDDGEETFTSYLPKKIIEALDKGEELARIAKAREKGLVAKPTKKSEKLVDIMNDPTIIPIDSIELNDAYLFKVKMRGYGESMKLVVDDMQKLTLAKDGSLPYEIYLPKKELLTKVKAVIKNHKNEKVKKGAYVKINYSDKTSEILDTRIKLSINFIMDIENAIGKENIITEGI